MPRSRAWAPIAQKGEPSIMKKLLRIILENFSAACEAYYTTFNRL